MSQICHKYGGYIFAGLSIGLEAYLIYGCVLAGNPNSAAQNAFNAATVNATSGETLSCSSVYTVADQGCILALNTTQIFTACLNLCNAYYNDIGVSESYCVLGASFFGPVFIFFALMLVGHCHGPPCREQSGNKQGFYAPRPGDGAEVGHYSPMPQVASGF